MKIIMNSLNKKIKVTGVTEPVGTGWLPPVPDLRDYTENHEEIKVFNQKLRLRSGKPEKVSRFFLYNSDRYNCAI
jgi:hypothetical protein